MSFAKRIVSVLLAVVMMMSLFVVNSSAAAIKKIEIVEMPDQTVFIKGADWDYGYWKFPEGNGRGTFEKRDGIISFMHRGGYASRYLDRGMLNMNGLVIKVTYTDNKTKTFTYQETLHSNGVVTQNIYVSPMGGEYKLGENTVEVYFLDDPAGATYKINIIDAIPGDVNSDNKVNATDSLLILNYAVQNISFNAVQQRVADINNDGKVNSVDALCILRVSVGLD